MGKWILYRTVNVLNDKFYIGVHRVDEENDDYLGSGRKFKQAVEEHGRENFERATLWEFDNPEDAYKAERTAVGTRLVKDPECYNLRVGGREWSIHPRLGIKHSEETRRKMSKNNGMRGRTGKDHHLYGTNRSEETKRKISKPVYQYDLEGNFIKEWYGMLAAAKELGLHKQSIYYACNGENRTSGGFKWKYKEEVENNNKKDL